MNIKNIEIIEREIKTLYIPYWEITFDFVKTFAKEKNIILADTEINKVLEYFQKINENILLEFDKKEAQQEKDEKQSILELHEDVVPFKEFTILDWTGKFEQPPTLQEVRAYIKELVNNAISFATLSPDWFIDIVGNKKKRDHILKSSKRDTMNKKEIVRHNKYIMELEELINNSLYLSSKPNEKVLVKPDIEKYHYFRSRVKIGFTEYRIILHTEQYKGESEEKPQTVHLYDVLEVNKKTSKPKSL